MRFNTTTISLVSDAKIKHVHRGTLDHLLTLLPTYIFQKNTRWCLTLAQADSQEVHIMITPSGILVSFSDSARRVIVEAALKHLRERGLTVVELPVSNGRCLSAIVEKAALQEIVSDLILNAFNVHRCEFLLYVGKH